ncbi:MAG: HesA/MoeB/ThiF family protein [Candidatus Hodarchaeales archaeon]
MTKLNIVMFPSFVKEYHQLKNQIKTYILHGRHFDNSSVFHLTGLSATAHSYPIGYVTLGKSPEEKPILTSKAMEIPYLHLMIENDLSRIQAYLFQNDDVLERIEEVDINEIDLERLFVRINQEETPLDILKNKKVVIIGLGSGGALLSLYLAKSGIKNFLFIDNDRLETHNIIRHICSLEDIGRFKTKAVKEFIESRIPDVNIQTVERKFELHTQADYKFFHEHIKEVDLIAAVSGEHDVNYSINDFIHTNSLKIPTIYAGTFDGVKGGLMFKVNPLDNDFCYHCIYSHPEGYGSIQTKAIPVTDELERKISYDRSLQEQIAQPGLGLDIDNLTILLAKFALETLLADTNHRLYKFTNNFYMWFNRTIKTMDEKSVRFEGLELYYYEDLDKDKGCPFHGDQITNPNELKGENT